MNIIQRCHRFGLPLVVLLASAPPLSAQFRGPAVERDRAKPPPGMVEEESGLSKVAKWPFRKGIELLEKATSAEDTGDPFVHQGADQQRQLAYEFAPQAAAQAGVFQILQPQPLLPGQVAPRSYPWPQPVDSQIAAGAPITSATAAKPGGGSRIVEAVRKANAKMAQRLGSGPRPSRLNGPTSLGNGQYATAADASNLSNDIVKKYLQRLEQEGTATGEFIHQVAENKTQQAPQAVQEIVAHASGFPAGTTVVVPQPAGYGQAGTGSNFPATATVSSVPAAATANSAGVPAYVQPTTQYVPQVAPTSSPPAMTSEFVPRAAAATAPSPQPPYVANGSAAPATTAVGTPAQATLSQELQPVNRDSGFQAGTVAPVQNSAAVPAVQASAAAGHVTPIAEPLPGEASASRVVTHVQVPEPKMPSVSVRPPSPNQSPSIGTLDEATRVLAVVGDQTILAGDVLSQVNQMLEPYRDQMTDEQFREQSELLIRRSLPRLVENKLVALDFLRTVPPDKIPELEAKVFEYFRDNELDEMRKKLGVSTTAELDAKLREMGSSLAKQQKLFFDKFLGTESVRRNVNVDGEITHEELLEYYRAHQDDFARQARTRWRRLAVEIDKFDSSDEAYNALVSIGNEVKRGAEFAEVAKRSSHGPRAAQGGEYDWTTKGSLRSEVIDELIFTLQPGKLSRIVEDEGSYHIISVIERIEAGTVTFAEAQEEIVTKIKEERFKEGAQKYLDRLRGETYVWTINDDLPPLDDGPGTSP